MRTDKLNTLIWLCLALNIILNGMCLSPFSSPLKAVADLRKKAPVVNVPKGPCFWENEEVVYSGGQKYDDTSKIAQLVQNWSKQLEFLLEARRISLPSVVLRRF